MGDHDWRLIGGVQTCGRCGTRITISRACHVPEVDWDYLDYHIAQVRLLHPSERSSANAWLVRQADEIERLRDALDAATRERDEARADERATIVAWLRDEYENADPDGPATSVLRMAGAIERGEHTKKEEG